MTLFPAPNTETLVAFLRLWADALANGEFSLTKVQIQTWENIHAVHISFHAEPDALAAAGEKEQ